MKGHDLLQRWIILKQWKDTEKLTSTKLGTKNLWLEYILRKGQRRPSTGKELFNYGSRCSYDESLSHACLELGAHVQVSDVVMGL